jgi:hypothetical protein
MKSYVIRKESNLLNIRQYAHIAPKVGSIGPQSYKTLVEALRWATGNNLYLCKPNGVMDFDGNKLASKELLYLIKVDMQPIYKSVCYWCARQVITLLKPKVTKEDYAVILSFVLENRKILPKPIKDKLQQLASSPAGYGYAAKLVKTIQWLPNTHIQAWTALDLYATVVAWQAAQKANKENWSQTWSQVWAIYRRYSFNQAEQFIEQEVLNVLNQRREINATSNESK